MQRPAVGLIGASGYSGLEALRLLAQHPGVELRFATSDRWQGETVADRLGLGGEVGGLRFATLPHGQDLAAGCAAVLLATPPEVSNELVPGLLARGLRVIDFSGAFRLRDPAAYPAFYGYSHPAPALLKTAVYGLPELDGSRIPEAQLLANPGCYATAASLALWPLLARDLVEPDSLIVDAASGVTGAGRKVSEELSFVEVAGDFRAYKVLRHQHSPEMIQTLQAAAVLGATGQLVHLTFTPHLLPVRRGILATCYATLRPGIPPAAITAALTEVYAGATFVRVREAPEAISIRQVVHTNRCDLAARAEGRRVVVVAAIDNLLKGAAGQALQNLNLMLGLPETTGLTQARGAPA